MLTGMTLIPGQDVSDSMEDITTHQFSGIRVEIRSPEPLPIKRAPGPTIHLVDVVHPQEEMLISEIYVKDDEEVEKEDSIEDDMNLIDQSLTDEASLKQENELDEDRKTPVSILKSSSSQDVIRLKTSSRVLFQLPDDVAKEDKNEDEDVNFVTPVATDEEQETDEFPSLPLSPTPPSPTPPSPTPPSPIPSSVDVVTPQKEEPNEVDLCFVSLEEAQDEIEDDKSVPVISVTLTQSDTGSEKKITHTRSSAIVITPSVQEYPSGSTLELAYQEPTDETVKRLLAPPDLTGFETPEFPPTPVKTKKKRLKSPAGGKKKKGKKKKKKKATTAKPQTPQPPAEPLYSHVPFAPDPIVEARKQMAAHRPENKDLSSAITSMKKFDELCREKMKDKPHLFTRMALSKRICRFWLPMDLRELQGVSPSAYLSHYCTVSKRRQKFYLAIFERQLQKRKGKESITDVTKRTLSVKECQLALRSVHANCIDDVNITKVCKLVRLSDEKNIFNVSRIDSKLFCAICALTERVFYNYFVTEDSEEIESANRHIIEEADFDGLEWRLRNVSISKELRKLLFSL